MEGIMDALATFFIIVPGFLLAVSFHECAHALVATLLGDPTPSRMGRVSLNPLRHLDPLGTLCIFLFRIGWAKPVLFNPTNFYRPRLYSVMTAFAGPTSNFVLATILLFVLKWMTMPPLLLAMLLPVGAAKLLVEMLKVAIDLNVMLGVFNFLPIPPLDGSHLIAALIPRSWYRAWAALQRYMIFLLLVLLLLPGSQQGLNFLIKTVKGVLVSLVF